MFTSGFFAKLLLLITKYVPRNDFDVFDKIFAELFDNIIDTGEEFFTNDDTGKWHTCCFRV